MVVVCHISSHWRQNASRVYPPQPFWLNSREAARMMPSFRALASLGIAQFTGVFLAHFALPRVPPAP
eukprot:8510838-Pyramimonas_sp.AAC.1